MHKHICIYTYILEKAMAPHSSTLAWKVPWMEEPGGLQSMGSRRVGHDWATELNWTDVQVLLGQAQFRRSRAHCFAMLRSFVKSSALDSVRTWSQPEEKGYRNIEGICRVHGKKSFLRLKANVHTVYPSLSLSVGGDCTAVSPLSSSWSKPFSPFLGLTEWLHFDFSLSCIGEGNGNPLQCSCLENPRDGGARWAAIYGVAQSRTRLKQLSSSSSSSSIRHTL